jgi:hypothetical protein
VLAVHSQVPEVDPRRQKDYNSQQVTPKQRW